MCVGEILGTLLKIINKMLLCSRSYFCPDWTVMSVEHSQICHQELPSLPRLPGTVCCVVSLKSRTAATNPGTICFPNSYPQREKLLHTAFSPSSSWGEKHWKHKRGKVPRVRKQVHLPSVAIAATTLRSTAAQRVLRKA